MAEEGVPNDLLDAVDRDYGLDDDPFPSDALRVIAHLQSLVKSYRLDNQHLLNNLAEYQAIMARGEEEERATLNSILVEVKYDHVSLTLRGKTKLFTPSRTDQLIGALQKARLCAGTYTPPVHIPCGAGGE